MNSWGIRVKSTRIQDAIPLQAAYKKEVVKLPIFSCSLTRSKKHRLSTKLPVILNPPLGRRHDLLEVYLD